MTCSKFFSYKLVVVALLLLNSCKPANEIPPEIAGHAAFDYVKKLVAFGNRFSGTPEYLMQADFIAETASAYGCKVNFQDFVEQTAKGKIKFRNIVADIKGKSDFYLIISTHCDLKELSGVNFQGANDGASGVAVILEMIRTLKSSGLIPPVSLRFIFFDGEECQFEYSDQDGLFGSRWYVASMTEYERSKCLGVINLDMVGDRDLQIAIPANGDHALTALALNVAAAGGNGKYFRRSSQHVIDDHRPFLKSGIPAINLMDFEFGLANSYWHTEEDNIEKISPESLEIVGNTVFLMIWRIKK